MHPGIMLILACEECHIRKPSADRPAQTTGGQPLAARRSEELLQQDHLSHQMRVVGLQHIEVDATGEAIGPEVDRVGPRRLADSLCTKYFYPGSPREFLLASRSSFISA